MPLAVYYTYENEQFAKSPLRSKGFTVRDLECLAAALDEHDHTTGRGKPITSGGSTPGTLSVSTTNADGPPHTHTVDASYEPWLSSALLKTDEEGMLTLGNTLSVYTISEADGSWLPAASFDAGLYDADTSPEVYGLAASASIYNTGHADLMAGVYGAAYLQNTGSADEAYGVWGRFYNAMSGSSVTKYAALRGGYSMRSAVTTAYGLLLDEAIIGAGGSVDTDYGIFVGARAGTTKYGIYQDGASDTNVFKGGVNLGSATGAGTGQIRAAGADSLVPSFWASRDALADRVFGAMKAGDTFMTFVMTADGALEWGPGGEGARDTNLYRGAANVLATDDSLSVARGLRVGIAGAATAGNIEASGGLNLGNQTVAIYNQGRVANLGVGDATNVLPAGGTAGCLIWVYNSSIGHAALIMRIAAGPTFDIISDPGGTWRTADTAGQNCLYDDGGNLVIRNRRASTQNYRWHVFR